jgi:S-adenosylmethionine:tRNA ribosyltransferase-isomerase
MKPATLPRSLPERRLLRVDPTRGTFSHHRAAELHELLDPGDLVVVNDAATLPASLRIAGRDAELRLVRRRNDDSEWTAVVLGHGDFRMPTEERGEPPRFLAGERLELDGGLVAVVTRVDPEEPRLVDVRFAAAGAELFAALYRAGRPVQYAYVARELELWDLQNRFAARPWAVEMPSAGNLLDWELLFALRARGVAVAHVTHAAGISSTGSIALDRRFPFPERYEIGERAATFILAAKERKGRVVAVGTTVVRALEANYAAHGRVVADAGEARLLLGPGFRPGVVDGILSGMHERGTSHFALLEAFADGALLASAFEAAEREGYVQHEFGDSTLVLGS